VTQSAETYDPDGRVVRSSTTSEHQSSSAEPGGGAQTTVANNVPTGAAAPNTPTAPQSTESTTEETVNYEISKNVRTEVIEGGGVKRLSVAVAIDNLRVPGAEGEAATFQARTPEELARVLTLVKSAVGFNEARGDIVTVENVPFARPDTSLDGGTPPGPFAFDKFDIVQGVEIGALMITALALVFFVLRPLAKGLSGDSNGAAKGLPAPGNASRTLSGEHASSPQIALDIGPTPANAAELGLDVARISGQVKASSIKKISEVVASHPDESLNIIRSWLTEEAERV
jgi:flagellar M-ring protein FliF